MWDVQGERARVNIDHGINDQILKFSTTMRPFKKVIRLYYFNFNHLLLDLIVEIYFVTLT